MISTNTYQRKDGAGNQVFIQIVINLQKGSTDRSTARPKKQQKRDSFILTGTLLNIAG